MEDPLKQVKYHFVPNSFSIVSSTQTPQTSSTSVPPTITESSISSTSTLVTPSETLTSNPTDRTLVSPEVIETDAANAPNYSSPTSGSEFFNTTASAMKIPAGAFIAFLALLFLIFLVSAYLSIILIRKRMIKNDPESVFRNQNQNKDYLVMDGVTTSGNQHDQDGEYDTNQKIMYPDSIFSEKGHSAVNPSANRISSGYAYSHFNYSYFNSFKEDFSRTESFISEQPSRIQGGKYERQLSLLSESSIASSKLPTLPRFKSMYNTLRNSFSFLKHK